LLDEKPSKKPIPAQVRALIYLRPVGTMTTSGNLIKWEYELTYHVPAALGDDGNSRETLRSERARLVDAFTKKVSGDAIPLLKLALDSRIDICHRC